MNLQKLSISILIMTSSLLHAQQQQFTPESLWELNQIGGATVSEGQDKVLYTSSVYDMEEIKKQSNTFLLDLKSGESKKLTGDEDEIKGLRWFNNNVSGFIVKDENKQIITSTLLNPLPTIVLEIPKDQLVDFKFSPKGGFLITLERIKTRKTTADLYPKYDKANVKIIDDLMYRHWDTWQDEFSNQLILYKIEDGKAKTEGVNLLEGTEFDGVLGGLGDVAFYNESKVFYATKKKVGKEYATSTDSEIYLYDIETKETSNWTEAYQGYDMSPRIHEKTNQLAWLSMAKEGFEADKTDIIVRDIKNQTDQNLTAKIDLTVNSFIWNDKGDKIYFIAVTEATYQLFELDVKTKMYRQITEGDHDYRSIALAKNKLISLRQSMLSPNEIYEVDIKTGVAKQLTHANDELLAKFETPTIEKRWVTTSDQKEMLTWVILPPNFDENNEYPTLLYCQGGPQSAVSQFFSLRWNFRLMASQGYVVVAPNRRGLPGFGQNWNDEISKDWGGQSIRDYLSAIDEISKEKYVDNSRIGAIGASYGGYSVYYLAGVHEKRFKTFISHAGLFNMTSWYGTTEELFFANWDLGGPYWDNDNAKSYEEFSPHKKINNWDTPILILHGAKDFRVPETQGFEAFQAAQLKGIKSRLIYFPEENHWILDPNNAMVWQHEFYKWLKETLN